MKLKERVGYWPPYTPGREKPLPGLSDIVIDARRHGGAVESIALTPKKTNGSETRCLLVIGPHLLNRAIEKIEQKPNMALHEVGNLDI